MEKAVLYVRVSTDKQDYQRQVSELQEWAKGRYEVIGTYSEKISGAKKNADRPQLTEALNAAIKEQATIVVWELSRLGRDTDELLRTVLDLKGKGVNVFFKNENISVFQNRKENPFLWSCFPRLPYAHPWNAPISVNVCAAVIITIVPMVARSVEKRAIVKLSQTMNVIIPN